jgi:cob(I)alamin adenosyltransferase
MAKRLTKIYTGVGDQGDTILGNGDKVSKSSARIDAIGDIDELNSVLGLILSKLSENDLGPLLCDIQHTLFDLGGELSLPGKAIIEARYHQYLENQIRQLNDELDTLDEFILPGGSEVSALCQLARAVCRRAERSLVRLQDMDELNPETLVYINRLSDLLFVVARILLKREGRKEILWEKGRL